MNQILLDLKILDPRYLRPPCRDVIAWDHASTSISVLTNSRPVIGARPVVAGTGWQEQRSVTRACCRT